MNAFKALSIKEFGAELSEQDYPTLKKIGIFVLTMFGSTYLCEASFSHMNGIKTKVRNKLTDVNLLSCMGVALTSYELNIDDLVKTHQSQPSH